jgi:hypothetical protein
VIGRSRDDRFLVAPFGEDLPGWRDDHRTAGVGEGGVAADAIGGDDKGLILDRPGDEERPPMMLPCGGPTRPDEKQVGSSDGRESPKLGKAEVVADQRAGGEGADFDERDAIASSVRLGLAAEAEGVHLRVGGREGSVGASDHAAIPSETVRLACRVAAGDEELAATSLVRRPIRRRGGGDVIEIDREANITELRQEDERALREGRAIEQRRERAAVDVGTFPDDVVLECGKKHRAAVYGAVGAPRASFKAVSSQRLMATGRDLSELPSGHHSERGATLGEQRRWWPLLRYLAVSFVLTWVLLFLAIGVLVDRDPDTIRDVYREVAQALFSGDLVAYAWFGGLSFLLVGLQGIFLMPIYRPPEAAQRARSLRKSAVMLGLIAAVVTAGLSWALLEVGFGDNEAVDDASDVLFPGAFFLTPAAVLIVSWILWGRFLFRMSHAADPAGIDRILLPLLHATAIGMVLLLPIDAISRQKKSCYCAAGSFLGLVMGILAVIWLVGPTAVLLLSRRRRLALRRLACLQCGHTRPPTRSDACQECGRGWTKRRRERMQRNAPASH